jgi:hypothetical protein
MGSSLSKPKQESSKTNPKNRNKLSISNNNTGRPNSENKHSYSYNGNLPELVSGHRWADVPELFRKQDHNVHFRLIDSWESQQTASGDNLMAPICSIVQNFESNISESLSQGFIIDLVYNFWAKDQSDVFIPKVINYYLGIRLK